MRAFRTFLLCTAAMAFAGCDDGDGLVGTAPNVPLAFTRFVNVVADHGGQDWRFIDQIDYSPPAFNLTFRGFTPYQGTAPGNRPLRIFPTSTEIDVTRQRLVDTTLTFEAGTYYTIVHLGLTGDGSNRVMVIQDDIPTDVAAGDFALRVMHFGTGWGNIDVYGATSTSAALPATPLFAGIPFLAVEEYIDTLDVGPVALRALPAGEIASLRVMANSLAPAGDEGDAEENLTPIGGTSIGGSAMLGIFTAGSVVDSDAPQGSAFVTTTGSDSTVYATATGYARMTGSFRSNNFFLGQEVEGDAFTNAANNGVAGVITAIQDFPRTGSITLERTATGYVRSSGSFVTDGFTAGMEIYVTGFDSTSNTGLQTVTAVTATELTVGVTTETEEAASGRSICANPCSTITVSGTVAENPNGEARVRGPRPGWVYIIDRHPR